MGPPLTLRNYMLQRARQHTVIYIIGWLSRYFSKKTRWEIFIWQQAYNSWTSTYSSLFEQYHLLVAIQVYSSSDNSIIYFAKTIAWCSSRNRFRSVPIFSPYSKTQTMSDSSLDSNWCQFIIHCKRSCLRVGQVRWWLTKTPEFPGASKQDDAYVCSTFMPKLHLVGTWHEKRSFIPLIKHEFRNTEDRYK